MPARCQIVVLIEVLAVQEVNLYADRGVCFSERLGRKIQEKCAPSSVQAHPRVNRGDGTPERPHPGDGDEATILVTNTLHSTFHSPTLTF